MNQPPSDPRQRLLTATADMLRRHGLNATSVREVAKLAQAPLGSTYHYFPGGKPQMVSEAISQSGQAISHLLARELSAGPQAGLQVFFTIWRQLLADSQYQAGCPIVAVLCDAHASDEHAAPLQAARQAMAQWQQLLADSLVAAGLPAAQADSLATLVIAAVEGAILLCRAQRNATPLAQVASQLDTLLTISLAAVQKQSPTGP